MRLKHVNEMENRNRTKIEALLAKGVRVPNPESVEIGEDVDLTRISGDGVVIHTGCKIFGPSTLILSGARLGYEAPVTIENCCLGPKVELKGGFFKDAIFLKKSCMGLGAHVREGTILEEESNGAHSVAVKHTILFPFVTLGSLINFCDCFMSGGTSRKDHSEVGSSYIHFNYTPNQDKATASLIGDVPHGVMLNQRPIFLGGQGGLVGPARLAFGTIIAAGSICRKDQLEPGRLIVQGKGKNHTLLFHPGLYRNVKRIVVNNIIYIGNLKALMQWYVHVRSQFVSNDFPEVLYDGLKKNLETAIGERIGRLKQLCEKMPDSIRLYRQSAKEKSSPILLTQKDEFYQKWSELESVFMAQHDTDEWRRLRDAFLETIHRGIKNAGKDYIPVIKGLTPEDTRNGTGWLQGIVDNITRQSLNIIPSFQR